MYVIHHPKIVSILCPQNPSKIKKKKKLHLFTKEFRAIQLFGFGFSYRAH